MRLKPKPINEKPLLPSCNFAALPPEIKMKVASCVSQQSKISLKRLLELRLVDKSMNNAVLQEFNSSDRILKEQFIRSLVSSSIFPRLPEEKKSLLRGILNETSQATFFENLTRLKEHNLLAKEKLIDVIKTLNEKEISELLQETSAIERPKFFHHIFDLSFIHKKIDVALSLSDSREKTKVLVPELKKLIKLGYVEESIKIALKVSSEVRQGSILSELCKFFTQRKELETAQRVARAISNEHIKNVAFSHIFKGIIEPKKVKMEEIQTAIKVAEQMPDLLSQGFALRGCCELLIKLREFKMAEGTARKIPDKGLRRQVLSDIKKNKV